MLVMAALCTSFSCRDHTTSCKAKGQSGLDHHRRHVLRLCVDMVQGGNIGVTPFISILRNLLTDMERNRCSNCGEVSTANPALCCILFCSETHTRGPSVMYSTAFREVIYALQYSCVIRLEGYLHSSHNSGIYARWPQSQCMCCGSHTACSSRRTMPYATAVAYPTLADCCCSVTRSTSSTSESISFGQCAMKMQCSTSTLPLRYAHPATCPSDRLHFIQ